MFHYAVAYVLPVLLVIAAFSDVRSYRIPNWLTLVTALLFFPAAWWLGLPAQEYVGHIAAGFLLFLVGFILFQLGVFGGGDAKLIAASALWFGMQNLPMFLIWMALAGGVLALSVAFYSIWMIGAEIEGGKMPLAALWRRMGSFKPNLPYGVAIAAGGLVAFYNTTWLSGLGGTPQ